MGKYRRAKSIDLRDYSIGIYPLGKWDNRIGQIAIRGNDFVVKCDDKEIKKCIEQILKELKTLTLKYSFCEDKKNKDAECHYYYTGSTKIGDPDFLYGVYYNLIWPIGDVHYNGKEKLSFDIIDKNGKHKEGIEYETINKPKSESIPGMHDDKPEPEK